MDVIEIQVGDLYKCQLYENATLFRYTRTKPEYFGGGFFRLLYPIHLSNDFLSDNGWELKNGVMVLKNDIIRLGWKEDGTLIFGYCEWPVKVLYVHHLQHIMRDVGLVEQANNFRA